MVHVVFLVGAVLLCTVQVRAQDADTVDEAALANARVVVENLQLPELIGHAVDREFAGMKQNKNGIPDTVRAAFVAATRDGSLAMVMIRHFAAALRAADLKQLARACSDSVMLVALRKGIASGLAMGDDARLLDEESERMALALGIEPALHGLAAVMQSRSFQQEVTAWALETMRRIIENLGKH